MASTSQFISGLLLGILLSCLLLLLPTAVSSLSLQSAVLLRLTSFPLLSSSLLLPLLFLLLYTTYVLRYSPYQLSLPLSYAQKSRHSKRNTSSLPPPYPNAFYRVFTSASLRPATVQPVSLLATDLVLFRPSTPSLAPVVLDAYCPHLGAHLGYGGKVIGDEIECPFHGWRFNAQGHCTLIPYADRVPDIARTAVWEVREADGAVWVWWDVDRKGSKESAAADVPDVLRGTHARLVGELDAEVGGHLREVWEGLLDGGKVDITAAYGQLRVVKERMRPGKAASLLHGLVMRLSVTLLGFPLYTTYLHHTLVSPTHCRVALSSSPSSPSSPSHHLFLSITPQAPFVHRIHVALHSLSSPIPLLSPLLSRALLHALLAVVQQEAVRISNRGDVGMDSRLGAVGEGGDSDEGVKEFRQWFGSFYSKDGTRRRDGVDW